MRLLLVEDDTMIGNGVRLGLQQDGFSVDWVQDGTAADLALANGVYDLMVLDLGLPKKNGNQILMGLRAQGNPIPVLILTARDAIADRVKALDGGADDLLMKPFDLSVGASTSEALRDWSCESPVAIDPVLVRRPEAQKKPEWRGIQFGPGLHVFIQPSSYIFPCAPRTLSSQDCFSEPFRLSHFFRSAE